MKGSGVAQVISTAIAAGSALRGYFPGGDPPMASEISSALRDATELVRTCNSTYATITGKRQAQQDVQYVAAIRNSRSKYGKKRRKNLRNAWRELEKDKTSIWSRYQIFRTNGFAEALGPMPCVMHRAADTASSYMPFYAFRLSSLPIGAQSTPGFNERALKTITGYRLVRNPASGSSNPVYYWAKIPNALITNNGAPNNHLNTFEVTKQTGMGGKGDTYLKRVPIVNGFRHEWSDVRMTFYPQTSLPTDWTVRLVKWKDDIPTYPPSAGYVNDNTYTEQKVYEHTNVPSGNRASDVTNMWDSYFGAKFLHPHNTNPSSATEYGKLPFVPLRTEKFYVPAREQTTTEAPCRLLHKFFFRNDRHYNSATQRKIVNENLNTVGKYTFIDENTRPDADNTSPFVTPGEEIWLTIEARSFKINSTSGEDNAPTAADPSFDIMMRSKHSYKNSDVYEPITAEPAPPPPPGEADTDLPTVPEDEDEDEQEPPTEDEPPNEDEQ